MTAAKKWYEHFDIPKIVNPFAKEQRRSTVNVNSRDIKLHYLQRQVERIGGQEAHQELMEELEHRMAADNLFSTLFAHHVESEMVVQPEDFDCLRFMIDNYEASCERFSDYSLKYVKHLVHTCEVATPTEIQEVARQITETCNNIM